MADAKQPSLGGWAVLALLCEGDTHGWTLVRSMAPEGEIGRVWSIPRALVYRTVELVDRRPDSPSVPASSTALRGSPRTLLHVTAAGRRAVDRWLAGAGRSRSRPALGAAAEAAVPATIGARPRAAAARSARDPGRSNRRAGRPGRGRVTRRRHRPRLSAGNRPRRDAVRRRRARAAGQPPLTASRRRRVRARH